MAHPSDSAKPGEGQGAPLKPSEPSPLPRPSDQPPILPGDSNPGKPSPAGHRGFGVSTGREIGA